jgi:uncharacterized membrane protein YphA (DoxX/SURF4 family)
MGPSIKFDSENFGKLFIRLFVGIFFAVNGVHFFVCGHKSLAILGAIFGMIGIKFSPVFFGGLLAGVHIVCGLTVIIGFLFRTSCFLLGLISLLEGIIAIYTGKCALDSAPMLTIGMVTLGLMFTGEGRFSATGK